MEVDGEFIFGGAAGSIVHIDDESIWGSFEGDDVPTLNDVNIYCFKREGFGEEFPSSWGGDVILVLRVPFGAVDRNHTLRPGPVDMVPESTVASDDDFVGAIDDAFEVEQPVAVVGAIGSEGRDGDVL